MKRFGEFIKLNWLLLLPTLGFIISCFVFLDENFLRALFFIGVTIIFVVHLFLVKKPWLSLIFLFIFSIAFAVPTQLGFLEKFYDPTVLNVQSIFLTPVFSLTDLSIGLILLNLLKEIYTRRVVFPKIVIGALALLVALIIVNMIFHFNLHSVIGDLRLYGYLSTALIAMEAMVNITQVNLIKYSKTIAWLSIGLIIVLVLISGLQIIRGRDLGLQFLGETSVAAGNIGSSFVNNGDDLLLRGYGTFQHPNIFAGFLLFCSIGFYLLLIRRQLAWKQVAIAQVLIGLGILFTFSRIGLALFLLNFVITLLPNLVKTVKTRLNLFTVPTFLQVSTDRFSQTFADQSFNERLSLLKAAKDIIRLNPLTGVGIGEFVRALEIAHPTTSQGLLLLQPVHNIFYLAVAEQGIAGWILIALLLGILFINLIKADDKRIPLMVITTIIIVGSFDHYLISLPTGIAILFSLILIAKLSTLSLESKGQAS